MNVVARTLAQGSSISERGLVFSWRLSLSTLCIILLLVGVLASALSVVYIKALQRNLYSELHVTQKEWNVLKMQWSQLLLEMNTWTAPARIQTLAQQTLGMKSSQAKGTVLINSSS